MRVLTKHVRPPELGWGAGAVTAGAVLGSAGLATGIALLLPERLEALLVASTAAVLMVPLLWRAVQRRFDPFEPLVLFNLVYGLLFAVRPTARLLEEEPILYRGFDITAEYPTALLIALVGAVAFQVGYLLPLGRRLGRRVPAITVPSPQYLGYAAVALLVLGVLLYSAFIVQHGGVPFFRQLMSGRSLEVYHAFSQSTQYMSQGTVLAGPALLLSLLGAHLQPRQRRGWYGLALLAFAIAVIPPLGQGARRFILPVVLSGALWWYLRHGKRPPLTTLALLCVVLFVGLTIVRDARPATIRAQYGWTGIITGVFTDPGHGISAVVYGADTEMVDAFALQVRMVPDQVPYQSGNATIGDLLRAPIPHLLWPGKPADQWNALLEAIWGERCRGVAGGACPTFSILTTFHMDLGVAGVFLGLLAFGVAWRALYAYAVAHTGNPAVQVVYAAALSYMVFFVRSDVVRASTWAGFALVPLLVALTLPAVHRRVQKTSGPEVAPWQA